MKVLVTGASGFLGGWLCKALCEKGWEVHTLLRPTSDKSTLKDLNLHFHTGDVTDLDSFMRASQGVEIVFHLAGLVSHTSKQLNPMQKVNVQGTAHAIEVCQAQKARLIHISSVVAVGASKKPIVLNEQSPYDLSLSQIGYFHTKKQAEILVQKACKEGKITAAILNPSTIYGPGDMKKESRRVQLKVAQGRFPFYTSGGVSVVDVESVVSACIKAVEKGRPGERYILSGENISIKELFSLIAKANKMKPPFIHLNNFLLHSLSEIGTGLQSLGFSFPIHRESARLATLYHWFDHSKAKQELDFTPMTAKQAINNSLKWWQQHIN
ncbi:MAG: NAD-dependent epimerase/dehydratase family protein [Bdellovibrionales bacterium]|nr:NAD-dependent epimerase/dehydratase family protein [Bdellovibrionales bacterium]